ncbi:hypothetical protein MJI69_30510, partial [Salmonella enterica subsp. enterica serovar Anatum]|nr:hypothetical protein [Salmonella enterica subsp. enterica serovar Anatum]
GQAKIGIITNGFTALQQTRLERTGLREYFDLLVISEQVGVAKEKEIIGVANFSNVVRGSFHACYLGYSIAQKWQGQGLMFEALT